MQEFERLELVSFSMKSFSTKSQLVVNIHESHNAIINFTLNERSKTSQHFYDVSSKQFKFAQGSLYFVFDYSMIVGYTYKVSYIVYRDNEGKISESVLKDTFDKDLIPNFPGNLSINLQVSIYLLVEFTILWHFLMQYAKFFRFFFVLDKSNSNVQSLRLLDRIDFDRGFHRDRFNRWWNCLF